MNLLDEITDRLQAMSSSNPDLAGLREYRHSGFSFISATSIPFPPSNRVSSSLSHHRRSGDTVTQSTSSSPEHETRVYYVQRDRGGRTVAAGTLQGSIEYLIANPNASFRSTFLNTYPLFTSIRGLFGIFSQIYEVSGRDQRLRILFLFKEWLHTGDDICETLPAPEGTSTSGSSSRLIEEISVAMVGKERISADACSLSPDMKTPKRADLAIALTALEGELFSKVTCADLMMYLAQRRNPREHIIPSTIRAIRETRTKIGNWVKCTILSSTPEQMDLRRGRYNLFMSLAEDCHKLRNFSSTFAIVAALHSQTFKDLPFTTSGDRGMWSGDKLGKYVDIQAYEKALRKWTGRGPCVPVLDHHLEVLTTQFSELDIHSRDAPNMIDYRRCEEIQTWVLENILRYRVTTPDGYRADNWGVMDYLQTRLNHNWDSFNPEALSAEYASLEKKHDRLQSVGARK
ncbi:hypothetical protein JAAARDRAFT_56517 [Jaapia argillacea MUCL 33604]|uniref:Ras-GEF domain-containing protein n=1 Tax=Jaapia argillacea MUCL 33604 TaxID=933084 RepID=A0A067PXT4_9AGAM|nr:hypothetical protein JAAARDRAFT_56517 [Jaapia argillacea MUCL 33604]